MPDQTQLFVITPVESISNLRFQARCREKGEAVNTIQEIINARKATLRITPYKPRDPKDPLVGTDSKGNAIFQYDPDRDGKGTRAWRLFLGDQHIKMILSLIIGW